MQLLNIVPASFVLKWVKWYLGQLLNYPIMIMLSITGNDSRVIVMLRIYKLDENTDLTSVWNSLTCYEMSFQSGAKKEWVIVTTISNAVLFQYCQYSFPFPIYLNA